ncbi:MAG: ABC transporter permease [Candidatus Baldrarchaeia archaeon]
MSLVRYISKRIILMIPTVLGALLIVFFMVRALPGSPALMKISQYGGVEQLLKIERSLGLDKPWHEQLIMYFKGLLRGDLGDSLYTGNPVVVDLLTRFPATFELALVALVISLTLGIPLGLIAGIKRNKLIDNMASVISISGVSVPVFWLGLMLIFVFFYVIGIAPAPTGRIDIGIEIHKITGLFLLDSILTGNLAAFKSALAHIILPAFTASFQVLGEISRLVRTTTIEILQSPHIITAKAAGIPKREIFIRDVLKNALTPIITSTGYNFGFLLGGLFVTESVFAWPGMGLYSLQAIYKSDYAPVQGYIIINVLIFLVVNLVVDILYGVVDPRVSRK